MDGATLMLDLALIVGAYLCGSIPMGVLVARLTGGVDPRTVGSGRTGGTNALRALGRGRAAVVVVGDLLKVALPVFVGAVLVTRYVSLGSLLGSAAIAIVMFLLWAVANGPISSAYPLYAAAG